MKAEDSAWNSYNNTKSVKGDFSTQLDAKGLRYVKDIARTSHTIDEIIEKMNEDYQVQRINSIEPIRSIKID